MASILLIEDMKGVRSSLTTVLETAGHDIVEAVDGQAGLEESRKRTFDLIITDIIMPKKDGSEVIMSLKQSASQVPILAISGGGATVSAEQALMLARQTANAVLAKPFSRGDLLATVDQLVASAGA